jgi:hypothetical protein
VLIDGDGREVGRAFGAVEWDSPGIIDTIRRLLRLRVRHMSGPTIDKSNP